jgi:hypothetical protein
VTSVPGRVPVAPCLPQAGEDVDFSVKCTCPCNFTMYYEVAARGNIVLSGQQSARITQQRSQWTAPVLDRSIHLKHLSKTGEPASRDS